VENNRSLVHERTGGKVGYVHIPDMGGWGYAEFHRLYLAECDRDGLIIDVRHNGGGHVSQLILEKLARKRVGYDLPRWGQPQPYPDHSPAGPMVAICNQWAGSDGDIFSHVFKLYGLGPLIGKRTWGGVIGISPRNPLADGSITTQPEFSFWFTDVGWGVENYGTDPDIEVDISPQEYVRGEDPQMERALKVILERLEAEPVSLPVFENRPSLAVPPLVVPPSRVDGED
jgi:tricorn protease